MTAAAGPLSVAIHEAVHAGPQAADVGVRGARSGRRKARFSWNEISRFEEPGNAALNKGGIA